MKPDLCTDVLICGAGAAGLTLAIELARHGVRFRLIDRLDGPFAGSRGKGIQPRTQEVFEDLGIVDRLAAAGGPYPPARSYQADGSDLEQDVVEHGHATPAEPYHLALMAPQFTTERVMRERLAELGHAPTFGHALSGFAQQAETVSAVIAGPDGEYTLDARYLVGADGGRSTVRHDLGVEFAGQTLGIRAVVADVELPGLGREVWHRFNDHDRQRQVFLCPLAGTGLFQLQAPVAQDGEFNLSAEGLNALLAERTGRNDLLIQSVAWASVYTMNARLAERYRVGQVFLVGDAAHVHPPTGGQGLNTSVQDAYNLGWKLAAVMRGAPAVLLDSYEAERRPVAAHMLGLSARLLDAAQRGELRRGREVQQLDIGYRGSPLALEPVAGFPGIQAGQRAPDAVLRGAGGQPRRLFELFKGTHWTLLGHGTARDAVAPNAGVHVYIVGPQGDLLDDQDQLQQAYAVPPGSWVLVRPDGYVGAVVSDGNIASLEAYLMQVGLAPPARR